MTTETLESRVIQLEERLQQLEAQVSTQSKTAVSEKRGWRAFVGVDATNPNFADAVRLGREWRFADSPKDEKAPE